MPNSWTVKHNMNCPNTSAPGALLLGYPKVLDYCADYEYPASHVAVVFVPKGGFTGTVMAKAKPITVNGVPVYVGTGSPPPLVWYAPSLSVEITASGTNSNRILHTLRRG